MCRLPGLFVVFLLFVSCTKEKPLTTPDRKPVIRYSDTSLQGYDYQEYPSDSIDAITGYGYPPLLWFNVYFPIDTICSLRITLPGDTCSVTFVAKNYYQHTSNSSPLANYKNSMWVYMNSGNDSIAWASRMAQCLLALEKDISVKESTAAKWMTRACVQGEASMTGCLSLIGEQYIPIKRVIPGKRISFGWLLLQRISANGIRVKAAAFNRAHNQPIKSGEH